MSNPPALAASLAKPVARGWISTKAAHTALAFAIHSEQPTHGTLAEHLRICVHILNLNVVNHEAARDRAIGAVKRVLRPMIEVRAPKHRLLAEAHNANADHGGPLSETEVQSVAETEVYWAMRRGAASGR